MIVRIIQSTKHNRPKNKPEKTRVLDSKIFSLLFAIKINNWFLGYYHQLNITEPRINLIKIYDFKFEDFLQIFQ